MREKGNSTDLTQGNSLRLILIFSLPILAGQLLQNLYNSVDSIVVGQFVGTTALAAVSSCGDISMMLVGFFTGLSTGAGVLFSRFFGAKDYGKLHDSIHTAMAFSMILGLAMAAIGFFLTPWLLHITNCPDDVFAEAEIYLRIYFAGMLFSSIYNVGSGVLRAVGDSKDPFWFLVAASCTNIVLDVVLVRVFSLGVMGVAIATVVSQLLSVILVFRTMMKTTDVYRLELKELRMDKKLLLEILDLGLPAAIQTSLTAISNIFIQRYINLFGSAGMAGFGAGKKIDKFVGMATSSIALALTTFVSQNLGAGKEQRAFRGIRVCLGICFVTIAIMGIPTFCFAGTVLRIFTSDPAALDFGVEMVRTMMPFFGFQAANQVFSSAVRGFGRSRAVMILSLLGMVGVRQIFLAITMNLNGAAANIAYAFPIGWGASALFVFIYYAVKISIPHMRKQRLAA